MLNGDFGLQEYIMARKKARGWFSSLFSVEKLFRFKEVAGKQGPRFSRLGIEVLENRVCPSRTVTFVVDYSPDLDAPDTFQPGNFRDMFGDGNPQTALNYWRGRLHTDVAGNLVDVSPINGQTWAVNQQRLLQLLDFNLDGKITSADALGDKTASTALGRAGAEKAIETRIESYFDKATENLSGVEVKFRRTDSGDSFHRLVDSHNAQNSSREVHVMYLGSSHPFVNDRGKVVITRTGATFIQPAGGATATVQVLTTNGMYPGQYLFADDPTTGTLEGGLYQVASVTDGTHVVLENVGYQSAKTGKTVPASVTLNSNTFTLFGESWQPPINQNYEWYGYGYAENVVRSMLHTKNINLLK
jgi:hypothetical protein